MKDELQQVTEQKMTTAGMAWHGQGKELHCSALLLPDPACLPACLPAWESCWAIMSSINILQL
jgi:hypothetical protein